MEKKQILTIIAENLRSYMYQKKLSVIELSRICNVSPGTISKIMNSKMSVTIPMAVNIACGLNINLSDLLLGLNDSAADKTEKIILPKKEGIYVGILSINNKRITCIKNINDEIIGKSELAGGLDLSESSSGLLILIEESINSALKYLMKTIDHVEVMRLNLVTQSYEFEDARQRFINFVRKHFKEVSILPDWQITYFTDFNDSNGISLITDKGVSLSYKHNGKLKKLGGWKYPVYDLGGVNWLGVEVIQHTIEAFETTVPMTSLANLIITMHNGKIERITESCFKGNKDHDVYSSFAEPLLSAYLAKDKTAEQIVSRGFHLINRLIQNVDKNYGNQLKIAVHGLLAPIYQPYFDSNRLVTPSTDREKAELLANIPRSFIHID